MILADFKCLMCGHEMEDVAIQKHDDLPLCTECFSTNVKKVYRSSPMIGGQNTPFKMLERHGVPDKKIVSGPHYRSK